MIIGISGKIGSGKDTVGKIVQYLTAKDIGPSCYANLMLNKNIDGYHNSDWQIKKFAGKLKQIVSILTGIPVGDLEKQEVKDRVLGEEWSKIDILPDNTDESWTPTLRWLLQTVGTNAMRNVIHHNIWVNALFADYVKKENIKINSSIDEIPVEFNFPNWIITDMRFPNELQAIKDRGGISIRVSRNFETLAKTEDNKFVMVDDRHAHPSETALDDYKFDYIIDNNGTINDLIINVKAILIKEKII